VLSVIEVNQNRFIDCAPCLLSWVAYLVFYHFLE